MRQQAKQKGRNEDLCDPPKLIASDEGAGRIRPLHERDTETEQRGAGEDDAQIEWHVSRLRAIPGPSRPAAPIVEAQKKRQDEQQQVYDHLDLASGRHRGGFVARCGWVVDDDFAIGFQHGDFH